MCVVVCVDVGVFADPLALFVCHTTPINQVETAVSKAIFDNEKRLREQGASMHATLRAVSEKTHCVCVWLG